MLKMSLITFFDCVVNNDTTAVIKFLARRNGNKRAKQLAIVYAAAMGNAEMVKAMLEHGMNANTWDVFTDFKRAWEPMKLKKNTNDNMERYETIYAWVDTCTHASLCGSVLWS